MAFGRSENDDSLFEDATTVTPGGSLPLSTGGREAAKHEALASVPMDLPSLPTISHDNYRMLNEIARGGMGRITHAIDVRLERQVAIKEMLSNDVELVRRFFREIRITSQLQHPAIVSIYEAGRWEDGNPFFAMRMVAGGITP